MIGLWMQKHSGAVQVHSSRAGPTGLNDPAAYTLFPAFPHPIPAFPQRMPAPTVEVTGMAVALRRIPPGQKVQEA